jgi:hypothetical protein
MTLNLVTITEGDAPLEEREAALEAAGEKVSGLPANALLNDDGTITLRLTWPAAIKFKSADQTVREEPIEDLVFHRLRGGDLRAMMNAKGDDASLLLFTRSIKKGDGRGPLIFDALDAIDARAALKIIGFLSGAGDQTGR